MDRSFGLALPVLLALGACSSSETTTSNGTDAGTANPNAKKVGDACTCKNDGSGPTSSLDSCSGDAQGCFAKNILCQLATPAKANETGSGTCVQQCTRTDEGKQGACPAGMICKGNAGGALICQ
jgi:hypothetical protein